MIKIELYILLATIALLLIVADSDGQSVAKPTGTPRPPAGLKIRRPPPPTDLTIIIMKP
jgi:hypothetical protein